MKSSFPDPYTTPSADIRRSRHFTNLLFSTVIVLFIIALAVMAIIWSEGDLTGEYTYFSPRLNTVRLSLVRENAVMTGRMTYGNFNTCNLELVSSNPAKLNDVNLTFETSKEFPRRGRNRTVHLFGKFEHGSITGVIVDSGTPYPVHLQRNIIYSILKRFGLLNIGAS